MRLLDTAAPVRHFLSSCRLWLAAKLPGAVAAAVAWCSGTLVHAAGEQVG